MKIFDKIQNFFESIGSYLKNQSNLFWLFIGAFLLVSVVVIFITSFAYECMLTKTVDKINKFLERNPRINDDNLVAFNNMMKAGSVPKTLRRQWQQFMLYREHPASYYMSFKHCVENPLRNSSYRQQMTVYKIISYVLIILSFIVSVFMTLPTTNIKVVIQDVIVIPLIILVAYWLISMVLDLIHSAISADLFQNYQYFEINMDKAMLTLPEFVDYEVLFSQDEIRHGIPVLFAYLQKRAIQEQQELERARLKSVDHEKFDFDEAGLDGSLVLDRAMRETENYTSQRKKYMQEIERVNNEIAVLENNQRERVKDFQRQVQTSKETIDNLKEQLEQASSTIEINYIKKQMRDELNRQQLAEKDFDIIADKHNQEVKSLNQEIKHYEEEIKEAKDALESAMLSEFSSYSVKVYNNLEKIVDDKMQDRVDDYKDQIKGLEGQLEEKNEELENVYTRYQEVLSQVPAEPEPIQEEVYTELPTKKGKKKKKSGKEDVAEDFDMAQPQQFDQTTYSEYQQAEQGFDDQAYDYQSYDQNYDNANEDGQYSQDNNQYGVDNAEYVDNSQEYMDNAQEYNAEYDDYAQYDDAVGGVQNVEEYQNYDEQYVPMDNYDNQENFEYSNDADYVPLNDEYNTDQYQYATEDYTNTTDEQYVPVDGYEQSQNQYMSGQEYNDEYQYVPLADENNQYMPGEEYVPLYAENAQQEDIYSPTTEQVDQEFGFEPVQQENQPQDTDFDDSDFNIDFAPGDGEDDDLADFDSIFAQDKTAVPAEEVKQEVEPEEKIELSPVDDDFDINKVLGLYDDVDEQPKEEVKSQSAAEVVKEDIAEQTEIAEHKQDEEEDLPAPTEKRKAGRPRKIVDEEDVKPKRKPGRPKKVKTEVEEELPKRKPGRPRKEKQEAADEQPKRKAGRPRKTQTEDKPIVKRKAGRPRKQDKTESVEQSKRKAGRPRKQDKELGAPKRKVGRPKKSARGKQAIAQKRSVGRPKKGSATTLDKPKGKRGRPRKN